MSKSYLERWAEEVLANHPDPAATVTRPEAEASLAALAFVHRAGARLVAACPICYPGLPSAARYVVLVPAENDEPQFRAALGVLRLTHLPIVARRAPLGHLPAKCAHVDVDLPQEGPASVSSVARGAFARRPLAACANSTHGRSR